jgi:hypothetical protein
MARLIPPELPRDAPFSERRVFAALAALPADDQRGGAAA